MQYNVFVTIIVYLRMCTSCYKCYWVEPEQGPCMVVGYVYHGLAQVRLPWTVLGYTSTIDLAEYIGEVVIVRVFSPYIKVIFNK